MSEKNDQSRPLHPSEISGPDQAATTSVEHLSEPGCHQTVGAMCHHFTLSEDTCDCGIVPRTRFQVLVAVEQRAWCPSDSRVRCVNCRYLMTMQGYTFCDNGDGPIGHVNFGCGDEVENEIRNVWCSAFEPQEWLKNQGTLDV